MIKFIVITIYLKIFQCGLIDSWDYKVDFTNSGFTRKFSFGFKLESTTVGSDFLKIIFPFALH